jgi:3-keto-5-aminohexanoate cleavage enzyme
MDELIITVTVDSSMSYPTNPHCPPVTNVDAIVEEYIRSVEAGASICHIHGVHKLEEKMAADGKRLSRVDFDGWKRTHDGIKSRCDAIVQYGIASARFEEKVKLMDFKPDMMSIIFSAHDENFHPDKSVPANEIYATHTRQEILDYCKAANQKGVKIEVESFFPGAYYNMQWVRDCDPALLPDPIYTTIFVGWPGGTWMPPTPKTLIYMTDHLPFPNIVWNVSCMDPAHQLDVLTQAVIMGGHVRVGWEDNPFINKRGDYAKSNVELVKQIVRIANELGRPVATPARAREIIGIRR